MRLTRQRKKIIRQGEGNLDHDCVFKHIDEENARKLRFKSPKSLISATIRPKRITLRQMFRVANSNRSPSFMDHQRDITPDMRHILIDWIVDVCFEFHLGPMSMFHSVEITDYVLEQRSRQISKGKLQLLGISAMILACTIVNYSGVVPSYADFSYISDNTYSVKEITEEVERIKCLWGSTDRLRLTLYDAMVKIFEDFPLWMNDSAAPPFSSFDSMSVIVEAQKNAELAIMNVDTYRYSHAHVAAACVVHARQQFDRTSWNDDLEACIGYSWSEILPVVQHIRRIRALNTSLVAVEIKYRDAYVHLCRFRRSQVLYVVPRPASDQSYDVVVDFRESDGNHQLLRANDKKASAYWLDLREIPFKIESLAVTPYNLPRIGDHVICYDRSDESLDPVNAIVRKVNKKPLSLDLEYASTVVRGVVEKDVELERVRYWNWIHPMNSGRSATNCVSLAARRTQIEEKINREREKILKTHWENIDVPNHLLCPITNSLMVEPALAVDGYTYERITIQRWMSRSLVSPMTGKEMKIKQLRPNFVIRNQTRRLEKKTKVITKKTNKKKKKKKKTAVSRKRMTLRKRKRSSASQDEDEERKTRKKLLLECFENDATKVPSEFLCPLTLRLLVNPVVADNGYSYEKSALLSLSKEEKVRCKNDNDLWPNILLLSQIRNYRSEVLSL